MDRNQSIPVNDILDDSENKCKIYKIRETKKK